MSDNDVMEVPPEDAENSKGLALFEKTFELALKIPGVKVNRNKFLEHQLKAYLPKGKVNEISKSRTYDLIDEKYLDVVADAVIKNHTAFVTALSAASGAPGNPAVAMGLAVADLTQYFAQVLMLAQKLAYIYGFPDLLNEKDEFTEVSKSLLMFLLGVSFGCKMGTQKLHMVLGALAKGVEQKISRMTLTKTWWYPVIKKIAPWFAIKMTKGKFAAFLGHAIPFLGAPISGVLTYISFRKAAKHLKKECKQQMEYFKNASNDSQAEEDFSVEDVNIK